MTTQGLAKEKVTFDNYEVQLFNKFVYYDFVNVDPSIFKWYKTEFLHEYIIYPIKALFIAINSLII